MNYINTTDLKQHGLLILQAVFLTLWFLFIVVLDIGFAVSVFWQFNLLAVFFALLSVLPTLSSPQRKLGISLFFVFVAALLILRFTALTPVKPFRRFHRNIWTGMTKSEVQRLLIRYFPEGGKFKQPELSAGDSYSTYHLDLNDGRYNGEGVIVYFSNGTVVRAEYSGD